MIKLPPRWTFSMVDEDKKNQYVHDLKLFEKEMQTLRMPIYLIYGTLLGAIREKNFISHDNDIDIAYLSKYRTENKVMKERQNLINYFDKKKMLRGRETCGIKLKYLTSKFDLWTSWFDGKVVRIFPLSHLYSKHLIFPLQTTQLRKEIFSIPNNSIKVLDTTYITWQKPITKDKEYLK